MLHFSCPSGYGMFTGCCFFPPVISCSMLTSFLNSTGQLSIQSFFLALLVARCCQTVYTGQVCSLSPVCSPKMDYKLSLRLRMCVDRRNKHTVMLTSDSEHCC